MTDDTIDEERLRDLQARTAKLPREISPPAEAWGAIQAEIERSVIAAGVSRGEQGARAVWQRPAFLAAAAVLLMAGSSVVTSVVMNRMEANRGSRTAAAESTTDSGTQPRGGTPATLAEFAEVENDYITIANSLSALVDSGKTELAPETVAKLRANIHVIDAAIIEARRALAADPANAQLVEMLSRSYSQKVDLLRRTTAMGES